MPAHGYRAPVAAIFTQQLAREFEGGIVAVDGVDLEVEDGEIYGFLGPNGAGKTTTVRMLTTLLAPTGGKAIVAGHDVAADPSAVRRKIGVALQEAALDPLMTGREMIHLQATLHAMPQRPGPRARRRPARPRRADATPPTAASAPTRAECAAASTSRQHWSPSPRSSSSTSRRPGSTPSAARRSGQEVSKLNDEGTTVFLTTQYLEEADQLCNRVGIITDGKLVAEGTPAALKAEVGKPHLELSLAGTDGTPVECTEILARFGKVLPERDGLAMVELEHGASDVGPIVRALDDAGLAVESLDLVQPTLDDVFVAETGRHLEGDDDDSPEPAEASESIRA